MKMGGQIQTKHGTLLCRQLMNLTLIVWNDEISQAFGACEEIMKGQRSGWCQNGIYREATKRSRTLQSKARRIKQA